MKITTQKIGLVRLSVFFFLEEITPVPTFKVKLIHINTELTFLLLWYFLSLYIRYISAQYYLLKINDYFFLKIKNRGHG